MLIDKAGAQAANSASWRHFGSDIFSSPPGRNVITIADFAPAGAKLYTRIGAQPQFYKIWSFDAAIPNNTKKYTFLAFYHDFRRRTMAIG